MERVVDKSPGGSDVSRTLADDEAVGRRRLQTTCPPVFIPPDVLSPDDWASEGAVIVLDYGMNN